MIKQETIIINEKEYIKTTTDKERFDEENNPLPCLVQVETGNLYFDAIDIKPCPYTYVEYEEEQVEENEA